jgi:hypothetical protein
MSNKGKAMKPAAKKPPGREHKPSTKAKAAKDSTSDTEETNFKKTKKPAGKIRKKVPEMPEASDEEVNDVGGKSSMFLVHPTLP